MNALRALTCLAVICFYCSDHYVAAGIAIGLLLWLCIAVRG